MLFGVYAVVIFDCLGVQGPCAVQEPIRPPTLATWNQVLGPQDATMDGVRSI